MPSSPGGGVRAAVGGGRGAALGWTAQQGGRSYAIGTLPATAEPAPPEASPAALQFACKEAQGSFLRCCARPGRSETVSRGNVGGRGRAQDMHAAAAATQRQRQRRRDASPSLHSPVSQPRERVSHRRGGGHKQKPVSSEGKRNFESGNAEAVVCNERARGRAARRNDKTNGGRGCAAAGPFVFQCSGTRGVGPGDPGDPGAYRHKTQARHRLRQRGGAANGATHARAPAHRRLADGFLRMRTDWGVTSTTSSSEMYSSA